MKLGTVIVGLLLAFLLFTSQGRSIVEVTAEMALYAATPLLTQSRSPQKRHPGPVAARGTPPRTKLALRKLAACPTPRLSKSG